MTITIRPEQPADSAAIFDLTRLAFATAAHSAGTEQFIVGALRDSGRLSLSLVAEEGGRLLGHVAFSPVTLSPAAPGWFGVGPISVLPEHQGCGIGSRLMRHGLEELRRRGAAGCVLVGEPAFYGRFGFVQAAPLLLPEVPPEYFQALAFQGPLPAASVAFDPAFFATA